MKLVRTTTDDFVKRLHHYNESEHSYLSASKMEIWGNCPGAVELAERIVLPNQPSSYAIEGTMAHKLAEQTLRGDIEIPEDGLEELTQGDPVANDFLLSVEYYVDYVMERVRELRAEYRRKKVKDEPTVAVEQRVGLNSLLDRDPSGHTLINMVSMYGTVDCVIRADKGTWGLPLDIIDYKHGAGVPVEICDDSGFSPNPQLMYYLLGVLADDFRIPADYGFTEAYLKKRYSRYTIHIVQPRVPGKGGSYEVTVDQILQFYQELVDKSALALNQHLAQDIDELSLNTGEWCRWCRVKDYCPKFLMTQIQESMEDFMQFDMMETGETGKNVDDLDNGQLSDILTKAERVERMIRLVRNHAEAKLYAGDNIPGFGLVDKRATKKWSDEKLVLGIMKRLNIDPFKFLNLPSPSALLKVLPKTVSTELNDLVVKESSGKRLGKLQEEG